ncbi:hypothetical protein BB561_002798 [Smittium simulii]|uniref:DUF202 domain-containing protein n=1 Tax=Smittium simulii TaxID=133385 RepID=A0A2T9YPC6_9FUNG|nr:hypothetical protein BB561_002798 [Smittium simulii]
MSKLQNNPNMIAIKGHSLVRSSETDALLGKAPKKIANSLTFFSKGKSKIVDEEFEQNTGKPKRMAIPVRVEPKVFFANERTFLSWLNFSIILGTISLGLVNFGDQKIKYAGIGFTVFSILVMIYSLYLYQTRATMILNREPGPYDSRNGPTVLVISLISLFVLNFYVKFFY